MANTIPRALESSIKNSLFKHKVVVLYGARQVGKTTLVKKIMREYSDAVYYQCDDFETKRLIENQGLSVLDRLVKNYSLIVFDEAQKITNIGTTLKLLIDNYPEKQFIATGSSSFDLANKINEPLTGRKFVFTLFPLSMSELSEVLNPVELQGHIQTALKYGQYPQIYNANSQEVTQHLKDLTDSYLYKDILELSEIRNPETLPNLLQLLAYQIGNQVSYTELSKHLKITKDTVQRYIDLLEKAFIIFRLPAFSRNPRKEVTKTRKIYFVDIGIRNSLIHNFNSLELRPDIGALWENFCIVERAKTQEYQQKLVNRYFWKSYTQKEVDYVEDTDGQINAWEFKWSPSARVKNPKEFIEMYNPHSFEVIHNQSWESFILQP